MGHLNRIREKEEPFTEEYFEELAEDHRFGNPLETFKVSVFYQTIDIVSTQLQYRFEGLRSIADLFLLPNILLSLSEDEWHYHSSRSHFSSRRLALIQLSHWTTGWSG